jgi:hypothetical protein
VCLGKHRNVTDTGRTIPTESHMHLASVSRCPEFLISSPLRLGAAPECPPCPAQTRQDSALRQLVGVFCATCFRLHQRYSSLVRLRLFPCCQPCTTPPPSISASSHAERLLSRLCRAFACRLLIMRRRRNVTPLFLQTRPRVAFARRTYDRPLAGWVKGPPAWPSPSRLPMRACCSIADGDPGEENRGCDHHALSL